MRRDSSTRAGRAHGTAGGHCTKDAADGSGRGGAGHVRAYDRGSGGRKVGGRVANHSGTNSGGNKGRAAPQKRAGGGRKKKHRRSRAASRRDQGTRTTDIVTSFVQSAQTGRVLMLRRSLLVKTMQGMWSGISGIIEGNERPVRRAIIEIFEETGITSGMVRLVRKSDSAVRVRSPQYENHEWRVFAFLFEVSGTPKVTLNWENSEYEWVRMDEISQYDTVPDLERVLRHVL